MKDVILVGSVGRHRPQPPEGGLCSYPEDSALDLQTLVKMPPQDAVGTSPKSERPPHTVPHVSLQTLTAPLLTLDSNYV